MSFTVALELGQPSDLSALAVVDSRGGAPPSRSRPASVGSKR